MLFYLNLLCFTSLRHSMRSLIIALVVEGTATQVSLPWSKFDFLCECCASGRPMTIHLQTDAGPLSVANKFCFD